MKTVEQDLTHLLQNAFSGELAAAHAYVGHGNSISDPTEKSELKKIENEELEHRKKIGQFLVILQTHPRPKREALMNLVGHTISFLCRLGGFLNIFNIGWYISMYGAGKLERGNIVEYEIAARFAYNSKRSDFIEPLLLMAEVEWDHEKYFRTKCLTSKWSKVFKVWPAPPLREQIRTDFNLYIIRSKS